MKVGYVYNHGYIEDRNIIGKIPNIEYVRIKNLHEIIARSAEQLNKRLRLTLNTHDLFFSFNDLGLNKVNLLHLLNLISFSKTPWVTTYETIVPRYRSIFSRQYSSHTKDVKILKALDALSSQSCKRLIAISECNQNLQKEFLQYFPQYQVAIEKKLTVLHPPQEVFVTSYESKQIPLHGQIHFVFVGNSFFRKGGIEILETLQEIKKKDGHDIKLSIVSSLSIDNYATKETEKDVEIVKYLIQKNSEWIDYFPHLPNEQVIKLMKSAHIGLLPTYADTYGFSVLEFQSCGCPVISTNVRALPEINNNQIGFVIEVPKHPSGEAIYKTAENRAEIKFAIKQGLRNAVIEIMENREIISRKANLAIKRISDQHSTDVFAKKLLEIYLDALQ